MSLSAAEWILLIVSHDFYALFVNENILFIFELFTGFPKQNEAVRVTRTL